MSPESWETSTATADATASVIMAKKMARTRSENSPISKASKAAISAPETEPTSRASKPRPIWVLASATP